MGCRRSQFIAIGCVLLLCRSLSASPLTRQEAASIALKKLRNESAVRKEKGEASDDAAFPLAVEEQYVFERDGVNALYLVQMQPEGFVLVAGDDRVSSILGLSVDGRFPFDNPPPALNLLLYSWARGIARVTAPSRALLSSGAPFRWRRLTVDDSFLQSLDAGEPDRREKKSDTEVTIGMTTKWGQGLWNEPYHVACPPIVYEEDFESGVSLRGSLIWSTVPSDNHWTVEEDPDDEDNHVAESGGTGTHTFSYLSSQIVVAAAGSITFRLKIDTSNPEDELVFCEGERFCRDGSSLMDNPIRGDTGGWIDVSIPLQAGEYLLHWKFEGEGKASIDDVVFPPLRPPAGCAAVAMAQILAYYRYPPASALTPGIPYDWENITDMLSLDSTAAEITVVSRLIADCGVAIGTNWGIEGSSANIYKLSEKLQETFYHTTGEMERMEDYCGACDPSDGAPNEWRSMIRSNIEAFRPIFYCLSGMQGPAKVTHACLLAGYGEEDDTFKVYINFGWTGAGNGWYELFPSIDIDESVNTIDWNLEHYACFEIIPSEPALEIISPSGGELYEAGTICPVQWEVKGVREGSVKIEVSRDGGIVWETIAEDAPNNGIFNWMVEGASSKQCLVRITLLDSPVEVSGTTTAEFETFASMLFLRGDPNADGVVDISDAIYILSYLFAGKDAPSCMDAADANNDESVDLSDAINVLSYLFAGGEALPDPFQSCGLDDESAAVGANSLSCYFYPGEVCP